MSGEMIRPKHPHLWIPDEQVVRLEHDPTGRQKPRDVNHATHGRKLLQGLESVEEFHRQAQTPWAKDLVIFQVRLAPAEKFQSRERQAFLREKGINLIAVKDRRTAVAASSPHQLRAFQGKVAEYQSRGAYGDLQYFDDFSYVDANEKQSEGVRKLLSHPESATQTVDVQIALVPNLSSSLYEQAVTHIVGRITSGQGALGRAPYHLADGTPVIRAVIPSSFLDSIAAEEVVFRVEETAFFQVVDPSLVPSSISHCVVSPDLVPENLPVVGVLDTGVRFDHDQLDQLVVHRRVAPGLTITRPEHGTNVASRVMFGDEVEFQAASGILTPRCRIADGCISDGTKMSQDELIERLRACVEEMSTVTRIFNLSFNSSQPIEGDSLSLTGYELDVLARKHKVQFVVSAGNHHLFKMEDVTLQDIIEDSDSRISAPGDSVHALTVAAVSRADADGSVSQAWDPAPFSRRGPGFAGHRKPDLTAPGGNAQFSPTTGEVIVPARAAAYVLAPGGGLCPSCGTSFSAPVVAGDLAVVHHSLPIDDLLLAKCLLLHTARVCWDEEGLEPHYRGLIGDLYGAGVSRPDRASQSADSSVTFVRTGELNRLTKERVKFYMPQILADLTGNNVARVRVTCVSGAPFDRSKGTDYCSAYVSASLHKRNLTDRIPSSNPDGGEGRLGWAPYHHFSRLFSRFNPGDWEIWLQLWTRWSVADNENIPYALAVTVEDPSSSIDIYTHITVESGIRYTPLNRLRLR